MRQYTIKTLHLLSRNYAECNTMIRICNTSSQRYITA